MKILPVSPFKYVENWVPLKPVLGSMREFFTFFIIPHLQTQSNRVWYVHVILLFLLLSLITYFPDMYTCRRESIFISNQLLPFDMLNESLTYFYRVMQIFKLQGTALDVNRQTCDINFLFNCYERCGDKTNCRRVAGWYYMAVRWFGAFAYQTVSPEWCTEDWVSKCML
jgi:hypothetical protein